MKTQTRETAMALAGIDLQLALEEARNLKTRLALELQAARDDRKKQWREFQEFMGELRNTLDQIKAQHLIEAQLLDLVGEPNAGDQEEERDSGEILVRQASKLPLFHTCEGEVYARIPVANHYEVWQVRSKGFRRWLSGLFFHQVGKLPSSQAMADALTTIEGLGMFQFPEEEVHTRVAMHEEKIYLDLANGGGK